MAWTIILIGPESLSSPECQIDAKVMISNYFSHDEDFISHGYVDLTPHVYSAH